MNAFLTEHRIPFTFPGYVDEQLFRNFIRDRPHPSLRVEIALLYQTSKEVEERKVTGKIMFYFTDKYRIDYEFVVPVDHEIRSRLESNGHVPDRMVGWSPVQYDWSFLVSL